jgi:hypothetical protein
LNTATLEAPSQEAPSHFEPADTPIRVPYTFQPLSAPRRSPPASSQLSNIVAIVAIALIGLCTWFWQPAQRLDSQLNRMIPAPMEPSPDSPSHD